MIKNYVNKLSHKTQTAMQDSASENRSQKYSSTDASVM